MNDTIATTNATLESVNGGGSGPGGGPRLLPLGYEGTNSKVQYYEFSCAQCGELTRNTFVPNVRDAMLTHQLCYMCNYWREFEETHDPPRMTIIDGYTYNPGNRREGSGLGMSGRRFDLEYIEPSVYAGQRCTTFDLWAGGEIPERLREKFPNTARFLGGAKRAQVGETTCWNPADRNAPEYPAPRTLQAATPREKEEVEK